MDKNFAKLEKPPLKWSSTLFAPITIYIAKIPENTPILKKISNKSIKFARKIYLK